MQERKVVKLEGKEIPRNRVGDPAFEQLEERSPDQPTDEPLGVLDLFTEEEVVTMVNRQIYAMEYQRKVHRERSAAETARLSPIKRKVRELFGVSFLKATEQQIEQAIKEVAQNAQTSKP